MKQIVRWFLIISFLAGILFAAFSFYTNFLLDYSLDSLEVTISATAKADDPSQLSPLAQKVYQSFVREMAFDEAVSDSVSYQRLTLLELADRSLSEVEDRGGAVRANLYLSNFANSKNQERPFLLRAVDSFFEIWRPFLESFGRFSQYLRKRLMPAKSSEEEAGADYSGVLLLSRAQEKEKNSQWEEAARDYEKYLEVYTQRPDRGFVMLSLSQLLMKMKKYDEASKLLSQIESSLSGSEEARLASTMMRRISSLRNREKLIAELEKALVSQDGSQSKNEPYLFRLGVAYLSAQETEKAKKIFESLANSRDIALRQKSRFYLGWVYKLESNFEESAKVFNKLLEDRQLNADLELGLRAQLADIYYQTGDVTGSLKEYERLSALAQGIAFPADALKTVWKSFAELELVNIYSNDLNDAGKARRHLKVFGESRLANINLDAIELEIQGSYNINLRDLAFQALLEKRIEIALQLFTKDLIRHPKDPISHAGIATVYLLMNDVEKASDHARQAYEIQKDDYTAALMGYVEAVIEKYEEAISRYQESLDIQPSAVVSRFNLANIYIYLDNPQKAVDLLTALDRDIMTKSGVNYIRSKILNNMGYAFWQMGDKEKAAAHFRDALDLTPDFTLAQNNLIQLTSDLTPQIAEQKEEVHAA